MPVPRGGVGVGWQGRGVVVGDVNRTDRRAVQSFVLDCRLAYGITGVEFLAMVGWPGVCWKGVCCSLSESRLDGVVSITSRKRRVRKGGAVFRGSPTYLMHLKSGRGSVWGLGEELAGNAAIFATVLHVHVEAPVTGVHNHAE